MKFKMSITLKIKMPQPMTNDKWYTFKIVDVSISRKKKQSIKENVEERSLIPYVLCFENNFGTEKFLSHNIFH